MGLNLSRGTPIKYYSSDRITQITGNGLVTLIDEKTFYGDFFNKNEMVFYNNISDAGRKFYVLLAIVATISQSLKPCLRSVLGGLLMGK